MKWVEVLNTCGPVSRFRYAVARIVVDCAESRYITHPNTEISYAQVMGINQDSE